MFTLSTQSTCGIVNTKLGNDYRVICLNVGSFLILKWTCTSDTKVLQDKYAVVYSGAIMNILFLFTMRSPLVSRPRVSTALVLVLGTLSTYIPIAPVRDRVYCTGGLTYSLVIFSVSTFRGVRRITASIREHCVTNRTSLIASMHWLNNYWFYVTMI